MATASQIGDSGIATRAGLDRVTAYAWAVTAWNILVIVWGALVRATGSGAGCGNHWPLCNGEVVPLSPRTDTIIEFTHRCMTGGATAAVLLLLWLVFRVTRPQTMKKAAGWRWPVARWAAVATTVLLLNEAFLGALLVKLGYVTTNRSLGRMVLLSVHLSNTLLLLGAMVTTAVTLPMTVSRSERRSGAGLLLGSVLMTIAVGVSGSLAALGDTLFPSSSLREAFAQDFARTAPTLLRVRWVHPTLACLTAVAVVALMRVGYRRGRRRLVRVLGALLTLQFVLGFLDVVLLAPIWLQLLHLFGADLFWVALVALAAELWWNSSAAEPLPFPARPLARA